jgi:hypothetical protein
MHGLNAFYVQTEPSPCQGKQKHDALPVVWRARANLVVLFQVQFERHQRKVCDHAVQFGADGERNDVVNA